MKKTSLALAALLTSMAVCGAAAGCSPRKEQEQINTDKTQLYVGTFDGGFGDDWLYGVKARFEEKYKDVSFEEGKKGVQVYITAEANYRADKYIDLFATSREEIMFTESFDYDEYKKRGLVLDISEAVTKPLNYDFITKETAEGEETVTLESKLNEDYKKFYGEGGEYYAIPFYRANYGISYDVDMFEKENFYFAAEGYGDSDGFVRGPDDPRSPGPDGDPDTAYDNGLPATFDDFFKLCDKMVRSGITPFIWSGSVHEYLLSFLENMQVNLDGAAQSKIFRDFEGHADKLVKSINADGSLELYEEDLVPETVYKLLTSSAGRYYALNFLHDIIANKNYYDESRCFSTAYDHLSAQRTFLLSKFEGSIKDTAMIIDGSWWENEANPTFEEMEEMYGAPAAKENRRFAMMPLPKATEEQVGEPYTIQEQSAACFVNANIAEFKIPLALEFLQFCHTQESLVEFSQITNSIKPYTYTMTDEEKSKMSNYGQSLYDIAQHAVFVPDFSTSPNYKRTGISMGKYWTAQFVDGSTQGYPSRAFYGNSKLSAKEYFEGFTKYYTQERWTSSAGPFDKQ